MPKRPREEDSSSQTLQRKTFRPAPTITGVSCGSTAWQSGEKHTLQWQSTGNISTVSVRLIGEVSKWLLFKIPNTGQCEITVPRGLGPGTHTVKVESDTDSDINAELEVDLNPGGVVPKIKNVRVGNTSWKSGERQTVRWESVGEVDRVTLTMGRERSFSTEYLKFDVPNKGQCEVEIPTGLTPGKYKVKVESSMQLLARAYTEVTLDEAPTVEDLEEELEALKDQHACKVCFDAPSDCVFLDCGHMCACRKCAAKVKNCPICRRHIARTVPVFRTQ